MTQWTREQSRALDAVDDWFRAGAQGRFYLAGYAGTGKTTLARHFAENCGGDVRFAAFTGKAASVLRAKGCPGATTIHKLIYQPKGDSGAGEIEETQNLIQVEALKPVPDQEKLATWRRDLERMTADSSAIFQRKADSEIHDADLVIVDESSMVDRRMGNDLESFGVPILYLGDPGQLPPVNGKSHLGGEEPDFMLEEIHRQAADSPIIWLASQVRQGHTVKYGSHGDGLVKILRKADWDMDVVMSAGQVITGMNTSRHRITRAMRKFIGFDYIYPLAGDRLICRKNDHDKGLLNGVGCRAVTEGRKRGNIIYLDVEYDGRDLRGQICDPGYFEENYKERTNFPRGDGIGHFDYGYCITGHKSQGSQWRHVVVADDQMRANDRFQRQKWLYTVITRAEEELTFYV